MSPSEAPVVRLVNLIIQEAVQLRASHIILRASEDAVEISYVINGKEVEREQAPSR